MNTIKAELNKIILALTSVGIVILLMFPASLSANHFRYGTMSWELVDNDTIRLNMENGWKATHNRWNGQSDYGEYWVSDGSFVGSVRSSYSVTWGGGSPSASEMHHKVKSRDSSSAVNSTITEMGTYDSGWIAGITHDYDNGSYVISWGASSRTAVHSDQSANGGTWRNQTLVRIGGDYIGNVSPVSAVPDTVSVQDNQTFTYQVNATDANGDNLTYRWGQLNEFFGKSSTDTFTMPTGMTLSPSGLIQ